MLDLCRGVLSIVPGIPLFSPRGPHRPLLGAGGIPLKHAINDEYGHNALLCLEVEKTLEETPSYHLSP